MLRKGRKCVMGLSHELVLALEKCEERFETFPTIPLCLGRSEEEVIQIIGRCLQEGKDVYELGYLSLDTDICY